MDMTESFEEMKARYLKQMEEMREKVDRPSSKVAEPVQNVAVASPVCPAGGAAVQSVIAVSG